ncbi:DUF3014 domain-containing protein [Luminiphilus sp.]|nr:DUF3014 domain-containing protein [Luminiphilus sp.]MDA8590519.1 DUF3014 domain-containing protein [Luminiphilus sp.]MDB2511374.1 DUF3014 domain-containing protein [Luminiphilus sp.]MDB2623216.1 DUF3014 domain-containing protein [Luminiphilus sp.]
MAETDAEPRANPIFLGILFAGILATLVFILMTGDYGEPTLPEELVMVQPPVEPAPTPIEAEAPAAPIAAPVVTEVQPKIPPAPVVSEETGDQYARESIDAVNGGKALAQFVAGDYVVERAVAIIDALRRGEVPYKLLPVGKPSTTFPISDNGLRVTLDTAGFSRYDGFAQWVGGLDTPALISLLNDYEMIATQALTRMGVTDFDIRSALLAATTQILSTPQVAVDAELMRREANWVYMDPELEALSSLQKQVLRMGPENADIVQQKARDIRGALLDDGL